MIRDVCLPRLWRDIHESWDNFVTRSLSLKRCACICRTDNRVKDFFILSSALQPSRFMRPATDESTGQRELSMVWIIKAWSVEKARQDTKGVGIKMQLGTLWSCWSTLFCRGLKHCKFCRKTTVNEDKKADDGRCDGMLTGMTRVYTSIGSSSDILNVHEGPNNRGGRLFHEDQMIFYRKAPL